MVLSSDAAPSPTARPSSLYRPELDGLRAVAVVPVLLFHFAVPGMSGGYIGVDVFFVLSGFFITTLLVEDLKRNQFSLLTFYERRSRRILPALFLMLAVVTAVSAVMFVPEDFQFFGRSLIWTALFGSNLFFWLNLNYFDTAAELSPLLHTWSLSVEEQFYIFYPVVLYAIFKVNRRFVPHMLFAALFASFALAVWASEARPTPAFYLLPTRAWELLIGCFLAMGTVPLIRNRSLRNLIGLSGLALIGLSVILLTPDMPFPGWFALPACVGAGFVIWMSLSGDNMASQILSLRPIVFVGRISYSLYLWHWPLAVFFRYWTGRPPHLTEAAALFVASMLLAVMSLWFIEQPFRRRTDVFCRNRLFIICGSLIAGTCVVALVIDQSGGWPRRFSAHYAEARVVPLTCFGLTGAEVQGGKSCRIGSAVAGQPRFAVWGDSHADRWALPLQELARERDMQGLFLARPSCGPAMNVDWSEPGCRSFNDAAFAEIVRSGVEVVYLGGAWANYAEGVAFPATSPPHYATDDQSTGRNLAQNRGVFRRSLLTTVSRLRNEGIEVVIIGPSPEVGWDVPWAHARQLRFGTKPPPLLTRADFEDRQATVFRVLTEVSRLQGVTVLWPDRLLCERTCAVTKDGVPLYLDDNHLSRLGVKMLKAQLAATFPVIA